MPQIVNDKSFGAVILTAVNTVLLIKQLAKNGSYWALPKGHAEKGESNEQTAIREVNEECGLSLDVSLLVKGIWHKESYKYMGPLHGDAWLNHPSYPDPTKRPTVLYYKKVSYGIAIIPSELPVKPQESEVEEVGWFPVAEAIQKLRHKSQQDAVVALMELVKPSLITNELVLSDELVADEQ